MVDLTSDGASLGGRSGPLVSVIVPGKDVALFVGDALHSLTLQFENAADLEVVFVDDGSADDTSGIVESFAPRFAHLSLLRNESSLGLSATRNRGLMAAQGAYVSFLDADDWFAPGHLQHLAGEIERIGCDFLRTDTIYAQGTTRSFRRAPQALRGVKLDARDGILPVDGTTMVDYSMPPAGLYNRRLVETGCLTFSEELRTAEDRYWIWKLHLCASSYAVVDSPGFLYRRGLSESLSQIVDERRLDYLSAFKSIYELVEPDPSAHRYTPKIVQTVLALTQHHLESSDKMTPQVRRALIERSARLLTAFPASVVGERVRRLPAERREKLDQVLAVVTPDPRPAV